MKYLGKTPFTVGQPAKSTACERCVYGRGQHADWCEWGQLRIEEVRSEVPGISAFAVTRPMPDGSRVLIEWQYFAAQLFR